MNHQNLIKELNFKAIRSSGAGGQHVNKVSSKIVLSFDIANSNEFSEEQTALLCKNLATRLTKEQVLILTSDESRSQHKNKELVIKRFLELIVKGLQVPKPRKATKPSKASVKRKMVNKQQQSAKKTLRKKPEED
ncbi:MAG: aminoacyl-tRNA hydrolase [Flavobacteriaceae bacterium]|nr:aminoacyl-tRNA hydrolase [Flavobacteriaceae bacterium]